MITEKIGIFGGTFNPIHEGHIKAIIEVQKIFALDRVLLIPSYIPPHKETPDIAPPLSRLHMVKLAVAPYPRFIPSAVEIDAKGRSYSILTLQKLKRRYPDALMFFILGVDAFLEINTWRDYEKVLEQCHFIVISRPGYDLQDAKKVLREKYAERIVQVWDPPILDSKKKQDFKIFLLSIPSKDVASKEIRQKVKKGESISGLVAESVEKYIRTNKLYQ